MLTGTVFYTDGTKYGIYGTTKPICEIAANWALADLSFRGARSSRRAKHR